MSKHVPSTDGELVRAARNGDSQAREALGRRLGRSANVFALQLTRDRDTASDVAQDAVLKFFKNLDRFDEARSIEPWLYQITRNRVRDLARQERVRRHESLDEWIETGRAEDIDAGDSPAVEMERTVLQRRIWMAVSQMSDDHREIFVLRDHHGLSYREIAEVLSIPPGTVMSRLHGARTNLRAMLGDRHDANVRTNPDHERRSK